MNTVQVTRSDGTLLRLQEPRILNDTLTGLLPKSPGQAPDSLSLPLSDIHALTVRKSDTGRTLVLIGGLVALGIIGCVTRNCGVSTWGV